MIWPFSKKQNAIDQQQLELLMAQSDQIVERMKVYEQAALDGEEHWMMVKCKTKTKIKHPLRRESDPICVT